MLDYIPLISIVSIINTFQTFFNTVISPTTDPPTIVDMEYDEESRSVRCISTGSPATVVTWMKDGVIIDESSTDYTLTQTITNRATSTYNNIVTVNEGAPGGVTGTYICTVTNDLGTATGQVVAVGELMVDVKISASYPTLLYLRYHYHWSGDSSDSRPVSRYYQLYD